MSEYMGWARPKHEIEVKQELEHLGINCRVALRARFKRSGKERTARLTFEPYFPGVIFADLLPQDFERMRFIRHIGATWHPVPRVDIKNLNSFFDRVEREKAAAVAAEMDAERRNELIAAFTPGQAITALDGPLRERMARFVRLVRAAHDPHPFIEAETELLGQTVKIKVDPLNVRAAE